MSEKKEKKAAGCLSEFIFFLLAVVVGLISIALVVFGAISGNQGIEVLGIALSVIFALLVFIIPYFRRNGYIRWLHGLPQVMLHGGLIQCLQDNMDNDSFFSIDRLVEFCMGMAMAQQMVGMMNHTMRQMYVSGSI